MRKVSDGVIGAIGASILATVVGLIIVTSNHAGLSNQIGWAFTFGGAVGVIVTIGGLLSGSGGAD